MSDTSTTPKAPRERDRADLLTASAFALLLGIRVDTLIAYVDGERKPRRGWKPLPAHIETFMGSYRWRPSLVAAYLEDNGYKVPDELRKRAARDADPKAEQKGETR